MATITGYTAERMLEIEDGTIVDGEVVNGNLILTKHDGTEIDTGNVIGEQGPQGPAAPQESIAPVTYVDGAGTITLDASLGNLFPVVVRVSNAFTMGEPSNPPSSSASKTLIIEMWNSWPGSLGTITWNTVFKWAGITWVNPAQSKRRAARFYWNDGWWVCESMTGDYS